MKFPVLALLRVIRRLPSGDLRLPGLGIAEAWRLTVFLDEIQEALWRDYGLEIEAYLDSGQDTECVLPPGTVARWQPPPGSIDGSNVDF